jgi:hypothetical protein
MTLKTNKERILTISDYQAPYGHKDAFDFVSAIADEINPTRVVCMGDEVDQAALGRFDNDPDMDAAGPELNAAIEAMQPWYERFPKVDVVMSNHTERVYRAAFRAGIPEAYLRPIGEWLQAPSGWSWRQSIDIEGIKFEHGHAQGGMYAARNLAIRNRQSTVIGHHHSHGGVSYIANDSELIFGMNAGCLIDQAMRAFLYGRLSAFKPTLGTGIVYYGVPQFVPMITDKKGRWTGELIL